MDPLIPLGEPRFGCPMRANLSATFLAETMDQVERKAMTRLPCGFVISAIFVATALAESPRPLEFRTISLNGDKGGMLAVVDGQPRLVNSTAAWTEWTLRETGKGWTIQCRLSEEKPATRFLAVDAKGTVTLVSEPGDGAYWKLTRKGAGHSFDATIQASGGKFDGWYLGFSEAQEQIERSNRKHESYRVKLSEKPAPRTQLYIFIDGP